MTADLIINGTAASQWGVTMGDKFIEELLKPCGLKGFVENADRRDDGKRVYYDNPRLTDRDITLSFNIHGNTQEEYIAHYKGFCAALQQGLVEIGVPVLGDEVYRLTYLNSSSFALSCDRMSSTLAVKFNEPDPSNRAKTAGR